MQDLSGVTSIFDNGLAIGLIVAGAVFFYFRFWPWYTKRQDAKDAEERRRHDQFLASLERSNDLTEKFTDAVNALNVISHGTAQVIATLTDRIDDHHAEVMDRLKKL